MTPEFRLALGCSVGLHVALLIGLPTATPVQFDVERSPTSVELILAASSKTETVTPEPPPELAPEPEAAVLEQAPEPVPQPVMSQAHHGAITEVLPGYLRNPPPVYPRLARERGWEGTVLLEVEVLASGRCGIVNVLASSGYALLDQTAVDAVRSWIFKPAKRWNQPVAFWVEIPISFRLLDALGG